MRADPFDPDDALLEIDRHHKTIIITLDVKNHPLRIDDARGRMTPLDICSILPGRLAYFVEPGIQCRFHRGLILLAPKALDKLAQGTAGYDSHTTFFIMVPLWEQEAFLFHLDASASSTKRAAASAPASLPNLAITCTPISNPPSPTVAGTLTQGTPISVH